MKDRNKSKNQLIYELTTLRNAVTDLERSRQELEIQLQKTSDNEARFREMARNIREVFWIAEPGDSVHYVSPAFEEVWGQSAESLYANPRSLLDAVHPEDHGKVVSAVKRQIEGENTCEEYRIIRPDGTVRWIRDRGFPVQDSTGRITYATGIAEDITIRKRAEESFRVADERFHTLFDEAPVMYVITQNQGGTAIIEDCNKLFVETLGYEKEKLIGRALESLYLGEQSDADVKTDEIDKRDFVDTEKKLVACDGHIVHALLRAVPEIGLDGETFRTRAMFVDVTNRKKMEEALRRSDERFRNFFMIANAGIAVVTPEGRFLQVNPFMCRFLGYDEEELKGNSVFDVTHPGDVKETRRRMADKQMYNGSHFTSIEKRYVRKDGEAVWGHTASAWLFDPAGKPECRITVVHDITERKRLEKELLRAQRLESAGRVAGQIAHDFNNLLSPLAAYPALIRDVLPGDHPAIKMLDSMEFAANKIADINQQLLALGRRGSYTKEVINLNDIVVQTLRTQSLPQTLQIQTKLSQGLLAIKGGGFQLSRVFTNLVKNAVEAVHDTGMISITTENIYLDTPLKGYKTINTGEYVKLEISDSGIGIEQDIIDKIFDPFFTTKKMDKIRGSGLGLSVVHSIVQDHEGYISLESVQGKGSQFSLFFPVVREHEFDEAVATTKGGTERILVIDDDPTQRKVASRLLKKLGYRVYSLSSGERAVNYVKKHPQELLILDMVMDGIDGTETYRQILEIHPKQKAIIVSGFAKSRRVQEALSLGAGTFVMKPVTLNTLATVVRHELDKSG